MPKVDIELLDAELNPTKDYFAGRPTVYVTVEINGQVVLRHKAAIVDTGANVTMIPPAPNLHGLSGHFGGGQSASGQDAVFTFDNAFVEVDGLGDKIPVRIGTRDRQPDVVLLGRDVLQHYRMVCDPLRGEFCLERP